MGGIVSTDAGLVQAIADNFDANISSPNGLKSTHSLALLMTQPCTNSDTDRQDVFIKRLKKEDIKVSSPKPIEVSYYRGSKKKQRCQKCCPENVFFL